MTDILMPRLSDSMEEGVIARWLKADGDAVAAGEEIVEIETDKATMGYEAEAPGVLRIFAAEGATVAVGAPIAALGEAAEDGRSAAGSPAPAVRIEIVPERASAPPARAAAALGAVSASPLARRLAAHRGVDLGTLAGRGPRGRIYKADVEAVLGRAAGSVALVERPVPAPLEVGASDGETVIEPSRLQTTIARRMSDSRSTIPAFALEIDVDMSEVLALRARLTEGAAEDATVPSLNDFVVKLVAAALRRVPRINGSYRDGKFVLFERVNVGIAVAAEDALVVPTLFDADRRSLGELALDSRRLAAAVRERTVTAAELAGATFTVSNLGMFGIDRFAGIVNPPQAGILCVGAVSDRPWVDRRGALVVAPVCTLTLVSDHRIVYGADAARFLVELRTLIANPLGSIL